MAVPTVTTQAADIGAKTGTGFGNVTNDGGKTISTRGVCIKTSTGPTIGDTIFATTGTTGAYTVAMSGLVVTTLYYAKAYAVNADGAGYSSQITFTTGTPTSVKKLFELGII